MRIIILLLFLISTNTFSKQLDFHEALKIIMARDTFLPIQYANIESSATARLSKTLNFLPTLDIGHRNTRDHRSEQKDRSLFATSNLNLFRGGADLSSLQEKNFEVKRNQQGLKRLKLERENTAITSLINMILRKKRLIIQQKMVNLKQGSLALAKKRYHKGLAPHDDVLRALVELKNARASQKDATIYYNNASKKLTPLLGKYDIKATNIKLIILHLIFKILIKIPPYRTTIMLFYIIFLPMQAFNR